MLDFKNILPGYESIPQQKDTGFILPISSSLDNLLSSIQTIISNKDITKYRIDKITKNHITLIYDDIASLLTNRFNFNIKLKHTDDNTVIYSVYPNYSYTNVINSVNDFKHMFEDKNILSNITKDKLTKQAIDSMSKLSKSINDDLLTVDFTDNKIYGIEDTAMNIFINIKHVIDKNITSTELVALILREIGLFFKDINNINSTYSKNSSLLKSLHNINPNNINKDKLKLTLTKHLSNKIDSDTVIGIINDFNLSYRNDINNLIDGNDKTELDFVNSFNLGDILSSALVKVNTIKHFRNTKSILGDTFKLVFYIGLIYITMFTLLIINIFLGIGALIVLAINALLVALSIIFKTTFNIFSIIFTSNGNEVLDVLEVVKNIEHIKRDLIMSLRNKYINKKEVTLQINNINNILDNLDAMYRFNNRVELKDKLYNNSDTLIEALNGNDLHYLGEQIN